jgi:hypothetical protein
MTPGSVEAGDIKFKVDKECSGSYLNIQCLKARMVFSHAGFIF